MCLNLQEPNMKGTPTSVYAAQALIWQVMSSVCQALSQVEGRKVSCKWKEEILKTISNEL